MANALDLAGQRFGWLTVLRRSGSDKHGKTLWLCQCGCGEQKPIHGQSLKGGRTTSCGCKKRIYSATAWKARKEWGVSSHKGPFVSAEDLPETW